MKPTLTTERVPTGDLRPYQHNPRNGDTDAIMESLRANGQFRPLVVSADGVVLAGNHTLFAAMELGWEHIDIVRLAVHSGSGEAAKIVLADNRTSDRARYDDGLLLQLLGSLDDDLYGTAFTTDDVDALRALAVTDSYYDSDTYSERAFMAADHARRTITIAGVPEDMWQAWQALDGDSDLDRLRGLMP
jgi:hypothetical protein